MVVVVCRLSLFFPEAGSLKAKRQGLRRLTDRLRHKFNVAVAEVANQDSWQRATLGLSVVSNEVDHAQSMIDRITRFAEELYVAQIIDRELDVLQYGDEEPL